jgi:hypothetical protein
MFVRGCTNPPGKYNSGRGQARGEGQSDQEKETPRRWEEKKDTQLSKLSDKKGQNILARGLTLSAEKTKETVYRATMATSCLILSLGWTTT